MGGKAKCTCKQLGRLTSSVISHPLTHAHMFGSSGH